MWFDVSVI